MAAWVPLAGATLHMPSGPLTGSGRHLFVVLNSPRNFDNYGPALCVALVNLSSVPSSENVKYDTTCVLPAGCHPSIISNSYVYYKGTRLEQLRDVQARLLDGLYIPGEPVAQTLLQKIRDGLIASPFTKREFKQIGI